MYQYSKKQIAKNAIFMYFRMFVTMLVSLYTSRIILHALGIVDFGIYTVVYGVVTMFAFLNSALSASTQRFLNIEIGKNGHENVQRVFGMSLLLHLIVAIIFVVLAELIGVWFVNNYLIIPPERLFAANVIYQFAVVGVAISIIGIPFNAAIVSYEHFNFYAYIGIVDVALKLLLVLFLTLFTQDRLIIFAVFLTFATFVVQVAYLIYCKKKFHLQIKSLHWEKSLLKEMSSFVGWNLMGVFAGIGYNQGVSVVLNLFFGPIINAARGISFQVLSSITQLVTNFQSAVNPSIMKEYSQGRSNYNLIFSTSKFSFLLVLLFSSPIYFFAEWILHVWLKEVPPYTTLFVQLVVIDSLVCSLSGPLQTFVQASGKIRTYQLIVSGIILLNVPVSYLILHQTEQPHLAFVVAICISVLALFSRLAVLGYKFNFPSWNYIKNVLMKLSLVTTLSLTTAYMLSKYIVLHNQFLTFLIFFVLNSILLLVFVLLVGLSPYESPFVKHYWSIFLQKLKKTKP